MPGPFDLTQMPTATPSVFDSDAYRRNMLWDGLTNAGLGLIQASAPSPYPQDFGTVFGGLAGGMARGMQAGEDKYLKRAMLDTQVQQAKSKLDRDKAWMDMFKGANTPTPDASGGVPQPGWNKEVAPGSMQPTAANAPNPNNIGNVRPVGGGPNSGFQQPPDFNAGVQLAVNNVRSYPATFNNGQPMTLLQIGERWAPKGDGKNDPVQWAKNVASISGLPVDQPIDLNNPQAAAALARGIHGAEWGSNAVRPLDHYSRALTVQPPVGGAAPPNAGGQGDGAQVTPVQYQQPPQQPAKTLAQVVQALPPGVRQIIGVMGPEAGIKELLKYADPETVPAIDARTGQVVFAPKTELGNGMYQPIDAAKLDIDQKRLGLETRKENREGINSKVVPGPSGPVPNEPLLQFDKGVSAAQGTDPAGHAIKIQMDVANKEHGAMQEAALKARTGMNQLNRLSSLLDQLNTGRLTSTTQEILATAKGAGIDLAALGITDKTGAADAAKALANQFALSLRDPSQGAGMPGALSDSDRKYLAAMVPNLDTTPEGRKLMVEMGRKMYQRQIDLAKVANDYIRSGKFATDPSGMYAALQQYADANPMFSEKDLPAGGMSVAPPGTIPAQPAKVRRYNPEKGTLE